MKTESMENMKNTKNMKNVKKKGKESKIKKIKNNLSRFYRHNKIGILIVFILIFIYLIGVLFLNNSFSKGTKINNVSVSGYSSSGALVKIKSSMEYHKMNVHFENKQNAKQVYKDTPVSYITLGATFNNQKALFQINKIKAINKWFWPITLFSGNKEHTIYPYDFDESVLKKTVARLPYFEQKETKEPKDAYISYDDKTKRYIIVPEEYGNNIDINTVYKEFEKKYSENKKEWNINESSLYQKPDITSDDEMLNKTSNFANEYLNSYITYKYDGSEIASLTPQTMIKWIKGNDETNPLVEAVSAQDSLSKQNSGNEKNGKENSIDSNMKSNVQNNDVISDETKDILIQKINDYIENNLVGKCYTSDKSYSYQSRHGVRTIEGLKKELKIDKSYESDTIYNELIHNVSIEREPIFTNNIQSNETMKIISGNYIEIDKENEKINFYMNDEDVNSLEIDNKKIKSAEQGVYYVKSSLDDVDDIFKDGLTNGSIDISLSDSWLSEIKDFVDENTVVIVY